MERPGSEPKSADPPRNIPEVFKSRIIRNDKTFQLNCSLLDSHRKVNLNPNLPTDILQRQVPCTNERFKVNVEFKHRFYVGPSESLKSGSPLKYELTRSCCSPGSTQRCNPDSAIKDGSSETNKNRCVVRGLAQKHDPNSASHHGLFDQKFELCFAPGSSKRRYSHSDVPDGSIQNNKDRCFIPGSAQMPDPDSAPHDGSSPRNLDRRFSSGWTRSSEVASETDSADPESSKEISTDCGNTSSTSKCESSSPYRRTTKVKKRSRVSPKTLKRSTETQRHKPHKCGLCDKSYFRKDDCENHHRTHTGERPFQCQGCGKTFACKRKLTTHMGIHRPHILTTCKTCGKRLGSKKSLRDHAKVHEKLSGPFSCEGCGTHFSKKCLLDRHLRDFQHH